MAILHNCNVMAYIAHYMAQYDTEQNPINQSSTAACVYEVIRMKTSGKRPPSPQADPYGLLFTFMM